jgi:hypothetical protein
MLINWFGMVRSTTLRLCAYSMQAEIAEVVARLYSISLTF